MQSVSFFGPKLHVGGTAPILRNNEGHAVLDTNQNGRVDDSDSVVLARNQCMMATGQVPVQFDSLQSHSGWSGRATSGEVAASMTHHEWAGSPVTVTDVVPQNAAANHESLIFHFEGNQQPYAEFILRD